MLFAMIDQPWFDLYAFFSRDSFGFTDTLHFKMRVLFLYLYLQSFNDSTIAKLFSPKVLSNVHNGTIKSNCYWTLDINQMKRKIENLSKIKSCNKSYTKQVWRKYCSNNHGLAVRRSRHQFLPTILISKTIAKLLLSVLRIEFNSAEI